MATSKEIQAKIDKMRETMKELQKQQRAAEKREQIEKDAALVSVVKKYFGDVTPEEFEKKCVRLREMSKSQNAQTQSAQVASSQQSAAKQNPVATQQSQQTSQKPVQQSSQQAASSVHKPSFTVG